MNGTSNIKIYKNKSLKKRIHYCKANYSACHTENWLNCGVTSSDIRSCADCYFLTDVQEELVALALWPWNWTFK